MGKTTHSETEKKLMQLRKCPKGYCPPLSDFRVSWKNAQLRCFLALNVFRTRECEHLSLELLPSFPYFFNGFGPAGEGVDLT